MTKYFRRVIYDSKYPIKLTNFKRNQTSIYFFPATKETSKCLENNIMKKIRQQVLERGVITFPVNTLEAAFDVAALVQILEKHQNESVGKLSDMAIRRGMLINQSIDQL